MTKLNVVEKNKVNPKRFFRSVRLETDLEDVANLEGYTLTNHVLTVLGRIVEGLHWHNSERAWTLTGPYGSGKSAFALYLANLLSNGYHGKVNFAYDLLCKKDAQLAAHFKSTIVERGLYPVALTLRRAPLAQSILEGLLHSLQKETQTKHIQKLLAEIEEDLNSNETSSKVIIDRIISFNEILSKKYQGTLFILDELGKSLEYTSRHSSEDVYLLQELAEFAARSRDHIFLLMGILHQSFEQYSEYLDHAARQEWAKVQGRFSDIAFLEPPEQQIRLAVQAIAALDISIDTYDKSNLKDIAHKMYGSRFVPSGLKPDETSALSVDAHPLHLTVLIALPYLFKRFAQNQRSLFAYLHSTEPFGLQDMLMKNKDSLIRLPDLFDYFSANISGNIAKQLNSRRWYEINDALERSPDHTAEEIQVLKTIGLVDLLGETGFFNATYEFISLALYDQAGSDIVKDCLTNLQKKSLIVFRRYNQTYKIWEGSDVDIEARLAEGHRKNIGFHLAEDLQRFLPNRPIVARKHSHKFGAMRYFGLRYIDSTVQAKHLLPDEDTDGTIVCCLPSTQEQINSFSDWLKQEDISSLGNVLIVLPQQIGSLREAAAELRAIHWVWQNTPELRDDRIARRELAERTALFEQLLTQAVQKLLDPRPEPLGAGAEWFYRGQKQAKIHNLRSISELLSDVMDDLFSASPKIRNELINKRITSSAVSGARRNLVERMLNNESEPFLGIEGYPPEKSIYESVLKVSGIHHSSAPYFRLPKQDEDPLQLAPLFSYMKNMVFNAIEDPIHLKDILNKLTQPPYGVMPGVFPLLFIAFLRAYPDEISLYRDGVFIPEPSIADFEVLMRRPKFFAVAGSRLAGERLEVVKRVADRLEINATTLSVTRAIINMVRQLPDHAWRTKGLSETVINLRTVIEQAKSPERLLFVDIPKALGESPFVDDTIVDHVRIDRFFNKLNTALEEWSSITQQRITEAGNILLKACNLPSGDQGWHELINTAKKLEGKPLDDLLKPFIKRLTTQNDLEAVIDSVLALVANRPPRSWTDQEVDSFPSQARQYGDSFLIALQRFEALSENEEAVCNELMKKIRQQINVDVAPHIKKAALARLLREQE